MAPGQSIAFIEQLIEASADTVRSLNRHAAELDGIGRLVIDALRAGGKIMTAGNGGSAAEAMHLAEELLAHYKRDRMALASICLSADATVLSCIANDYGFDDVFSRQIEGLARPGDVLALFSTSGNSENVCRAAVAARRAGAHVVGLSGKGGGRLRPLCDVALVVDSEATERIQEAHQAALHIIMELVEAAFCEPLPGGRS